MIIGGVLQMTDPTSDTLFYKQLLKSAQNKAQYMSERKALAEVASENELNFREQTKLEFLYWNTK